MPNSLIVLIEIFVVVYTVYVAQRFIMNVRTMISQKNAKKSLDKYTKYADIIMETAIKSLTSMLLGDTGSTKKEKTTSEKDEDLNGSDDPDVNDFLN